MKVIRVNDLVTVFFSDGTSAQREMTDNEFNDVFGDFYDDIDEEDIKEVMYPKYQEELREYNECIDTLDKAKESDILVIKGDSVYWEEVSQLSMPLELVKAVIKAEEEDDEDKLEAYKNFWTLMSLNPDSRCRQNLFWFLQKYGMVISKYGLFVGYRNADTLSKGDALEKYPQNLINVVKQTSERIKTVTKKSLKNYYVEKVGEWFCVNKSDTHCDLQSNCLYNLYNYFKERNFDYDLINPNTNTVYTDHHSHTFKIKIGEKVTMPREECDSVQEHSCSKGLHIGGLSWLEENYYGDTGLICLINPADVVAVPPIDDYGKLRTCAYLPIGTVKYDDFGKVIPYDLNDGFKSKYVTEILFDGEKSTEDIATYKFTIPNIPELNQEVITDRLREIAKEAIKDRVQ